MKKETKTKGFFIKMTPEEDQIVKELKDVYSINISSFLRNSLINYHKKLKKLNK